MYYVITNVYGQFVHATLSGAKQHARLWKELKNVESKLSVRK